MKGKEKIKKHNRLLLKQIQKLTINDNPNSGFSGITSHDLHHQIVSLVIMKHKYPRKFYTWHLRTFCLFHDHVTQHRNLKMYTSATAGACFVSCWFKGQDWTLKLKKINETITSLNFRGKYSLDRASLLEAQHCTVVAPVYDAVNLFNGHFG